jgi:hypothetical protein
LSDGVATSTALLPVTVTAASEMKLETAGATADARASSGGAIHIELPGRAMISVENGADPAVVSCVLESLRK